MNYSNFVLKHAEITVKYDNIEYRSIMFALTIFSHQIVVLLLHCVHLGDLFPYEVHLEGRGFAFSLCSFPGATKRFAFGADKMSLSM